MNASARSAPPPAAFTARRLTFRDWVLEGIGQALAANHVSPVARRPMPMPAGPETAERVGGLDDPARRHAAGLMRVNHVGEVCAQALYHGQAAGAADPALRSFFLESAAEEGDHLAWTRQRLDELQDRPSLLNPAWYAGAYALGLMAARAGDARSLGFTVETERQVEEHLASHMDHLPAADVESRAIVDAMKKDEIAHGQAARRLGAAELPAPVKWAMRLAARVMTTTAYRI